MHFLLRSPGRIKRKYRAIHPIIPIRSSLRFNSARHVQQDVLDLPSRKRIARTKRSLLSLPSVLLDSSGSPVEPLGAWGGGLGEPSTSIEAHHQVSMSRNQEDARQADSQNVVTSPLPLKRQRTTKANKKDEPCSAKAGDLPASLPSTPLASDILANLAKFPHCILLTRVGQFFESYFQQAPEVATLLNIKLTSKVWGGERVPMCGFPLIHLDKHLKTLVQKHHRFVALCDEFTRGPSSGPKGFDRRVTRVVTPGTLIDETFINPYENNYLLAIAHGKDLSPHTKLQERIGLAWIDVSTGEFFTKLVPPDALRDHLAQIGPKEVVLDNSLRSLPNHATRQVLAEEGFLASYDTLVTGSSRPDDTLHSLQSDDVNTFSCGLQPMEEVTPLTAMEREAVQLLTSFMSANLLDHMPLLPPPRKESMDTRMQIDTHTIRSLEIRETISGSSTGSLLNVIKKTVTTSGTRLLERWLCSPSVSLVEINARQSLVSFFKARPHLRADLVQSLREADDITRIVQKFRLGRGGIDDLAGMRDTLVVWSYLRQRIRAERNVEQKDRGIVEEYHWGSLDALISKMSSFQDLAHRIGTSITSKTADFEVESSPLPIGSNEWRIDVGFSQELTSLHDNLKRLISDRDNLERELREKYTASSLTLRTSPQQGSHVHIARVKRDLNKFRADPSFVVVTETKSTCTLFYLPWSTLGTKIAEASAAIHNAEREAFDALRDEVVSHDFSLRKNARILDELDVTLSFANAAEELNLVRPTMRDDTSFQVKHGRHPTVELGLLSAGRTFIPNSVSFTSDAPLHIITGPNMAGKSTLLRQIALISVLAQIGSFVPAESAELGVVDCVFSRVGARDDLFRHRSTFMVEMLETADILRRATPRSLVIMDEVGRGTTVADGVAIAFSTIHHLLTVNKCRALFATHFHELADMLGYCSDHRGRGVFAGVQFFCTDVDETEDGHFAYSHRLRPGINRDSHGLKVAQLAGMPSPTLRMASTAISWFKERSISDESKTELQILGQTLASNKNF